MSKEEFNNLTENRKLHLLIDAKKISEKVDDVATCQIFQINDFFVEVSMSVTWRFRKIEKVYSLND